MRFMFSGVPAFGHLLPFAPLVRAARTAGHDVALLTSGGMAQAVSADLPGAEFLAAGPMPDELFAEVGRRTGVADAAADPQPVAVAEFFAGVRIDLSADDAIAAARDWAPEVIICEATDFVGPLVASALGVPWNMLALGPSVPPEFTAPMLALAAKRYVDRGLTRTPPEFYIDPVPAVLQTPGFRTPARHLPIRAEAHQRPHRSTPVQPAVPLGQRPRALVTLGTVFSDGALLDTIVQSLIREDVAVIATLGINGMAAPATPGVDYYPFAPLAELLDVDVVICAGGSGTVLGALSRGIPLVVLPQGADQPLNAARTEAAGVAVVIHDAGETAAATRRVLSEPSFGAAARTIAGQIAASPTPTDIIETLESVTAKAAAPR